MSQMHGPHESVPPATQSTSRKENNTTGIHYTQSSAQPIQSQKAEDRSFTHGVTKKSNNCIVIDEDSYSDQSPREKFCSQPVATQGMEHVPKKVHQSKNNNKHKLSRRSRSRTGTLDQEEMFKEALAQKKERELLKHQTAIQESSSNIHLSELERSAQPLHHTEKKPKAHSKLAQSPSQYASDKKQQQSNTKSRTNSSKHRSTVGHHRSTSISHLNPRKISVQSKRLTRQQAKNTHKPVQQSIASSVLEYDMESCEVTEKQMQPRSRELEQIIAASSSSNNRHVIAEQEEQQEISETDSEVDMEDDVEQSQEVSEVLEDHQESISMTTNSMVVQTCQNNLPPSIVSHGTYKEQHSNLNNAGQVRKMFQSGGVVATKQSKKSRQSNHQMKQPQRALVVRKTHHGSHGQQPVVETARRSSRHQRHGY